MPFVLRRGLRISKMGRRGNERKMREWRTGKKRKKGDEKTRRKREGKGRNSSIIFKNKVKCQIISC